jgi:hypothetical protein
MTRPFTLRPWYFPVLIALVIAFAYSFRWVYPCYEQYKTTGQCTYSFPERPGSDDYFYYAKIRKIIDGRFFDFDPMTYENRHTVSPHSTYHFSFVLGAIGGWLRGKTADAFRFNNFVFPFLSVLLAYFFINLCVNHSSLAILLSLIATLTGMFFNNSDYPFMLMMKKGPALIHNLRLAWSARATDLLAMTYLYRAPNIQITNVCLTAFAVLLLITFRQEKSRHRTWLALAFILGTSSLVSTANFVLSFGMFSMFLLICFPRGEKQRRYLGVFALAMLFAIPGLWVQMKARPMFTEVSQLSLPGIPTPKWGLWALRDFLYLVIPAALVGILGWKKPVGRFLFALSMGVISAYSLIHILMGSDFSGRIISTGAEVFFSTIILSTLGMVYQRGAPRLGPAVQKYGPYTFAALAAAFAVLVLGNQYRIRQKYDFSYEPDFTQLCEWSRSLERPAVAVTLDPYLIFNLPSCSPWFHYIPQALLSPTAEKERLRRLAEVAHFYGFTENNFRDFTRQLLPVERFKRYTYGPGPLDAKERYEEIHSLFTFILFYGQYMYKTIPADRLAEMSSIFSGAGGDPSSPLKYRSDYLVVSNSDISWLKPQSPAFRTISTPPLFRNGTYVVYRITH